MSRTRSPSTKRLYGIQRVCAVWGVSRSAHYAQRRAGLALVRPVGLRPGPAPKLSDEELAGRIRSVISDVEDSFGFRGEGYRKVFVRLRALGVPASKHRVLRVMREHDLLATRRSTRKRGPTVHNGTIQTDVPNEMWGADGTMIWTRSQGYVWVFIAIDHCNSELVGVHASVSGSRFEALEPIRQGLRAHFGEPRAGLAEGLAIRHDHGSQYMSRAFQDELRFFEIRSSPNYVGQPQGNGIAERMMKTLKHQLLWLQTWEDVDQVNKALQAFRTTYNNHWMLGRWGYKSPATMRVRTSGVTA